MEDCCLSVEWWSMTQIVLELVEKAYSSILSEGDGRMNIPKDSPQTYKSFVCSKCRKTNKDQHGWAFQQQSSETSFHLKLQGWLIFVYRHHLSPNSFLLLLFSSSRWWKSATGIKNTAVFGAPSERTEILRVEPFALQRSIIQSELQLQTYWKNMSVVRQ